MLVPGGGRGAEEGAGEQISLQCLASEWQILAVGHKNLWHDGKQRTPDKHTIGDRGPNKVGRHLCYQLDSCQKLILPGRADVIH